MNILDAFPHKYLKAIDIGHREYTVTIQELRTEMLRDPHTKQPAERYVLYFEGASKGLILSPPLAHALADLHGVDTDYWPGKRITLYVEFGIPAFGKLYDVVRIRTAMRSLRNDIPTED